MFKINPSFKENMISCLDLTLKDVTEILAEQSRKVIETERYWQDWVTSNPFRDIVDTNEMNQSMVIEQISSKIYRISWNTPYVIYVYFGHSTPSGNRIPARMWVMLAIEENDFEDIVQNIFTQHFNSFS